jgi:hypothetical protein
MFALPKDAARKGELLIAAFVGLAATPGTALAARARARGESLSVRPRTALGWWAVGLAPGAAALFGLAAFLPALMGVPAGIFRGLVALALVGAVVAGLTAWFRRGERSVLVLVAMAPAMVVPYLAVGMMLFPYWPTSRTGPIPSSAQRR